MSNDLYAIVDGEVHSFNCYKDYTELDALVAYANTEEHAMELVPESCTEFWYFPL